MYPNVSAITVDRQEDLEEDNDDDVSKEDLDTSIQSAKMLLSHSVKYFVKSDKLSSSLTSTMLDSINSVVKLRKIYEIFRKNYFLQGNTKLIPKMLNNLVEIWPQLERGLQENPVNLFDETKESISLISLEKYLETLL